MANKEDKKIAQVFSIFGTPEVQFNKYESLLPKNEYDHDKAEVLAEAMSELVIINKRKKHLEEILEHNKALAPYLWKDMSGRVQALHKVDDARLQNVVKFLMLKGHTISKEMRAEAMSRGINIPENYTSDYEGYYDDEAYDGVDRSDIWG